MGLARAREYIQRSPRFRSYPDRFTSYVRYIEAGDKTDGKAAQFEDVSMSGMRIISRLPTTARVGDFLNIEFTLPGSQRKIRNRAQVVRKKNEFVFAVRFMGLEGGLDIQLRNAIDDYVSFIQRSEWLGPFMRVADWVHKHKQGLWISFVGILVLGGAGTLIYLSSDEYQGRSLRSWGQPLPKEWFLDYYNKFQKPGKN